MVGYRSEKSEEVSGGFAVIDWVVVILVLMLEIGVFLVWLVRYGVGGLDSV